MGGKGKNGWPLLAAEQLRRQGFEINLTVGAEGGSGYVKANSKGTLFSDQISKAVVSNDRVVVLFGSINDGSAARDELGTAVRCTLDNIKAVAPYTRLLVVGPAWVDANPPARILRVRDVVKSQADRVGATFVDPIAEGWFLDHPEFIGSDHTHPTDAGHQYMAQKMAPLIAEQLQASPTG